MADNQTSTTSQSSLKKISAALLGTALLGLASYYAYKKATSSQVEKTSAAEKTQQKNKQIDDENEDSWETDEDCSENERVELDKEQRKQSLIQRKPTGFVKENLPVDELDDDEDDEEAAQ